MAKGKPMYFLGLEIENVRCFGSRQHLDLSDGNGNPAQWTVILGENGVGKTTLLHCLTSMRPALSPAGDDYRLGSTVTPEDRNEREQAGFHALKPMLDDLEGDYDWFFGSAQNEIASLGAEYQIGKKLDSDAETKIESLSFQNQIEREDGKFKGITLKVGWLSGFFEPHLFAYSAGRHMEQNNIESPDLSNPVFNLTSDRGELYDAAQILNRFNYRALMKIHQNNDGGKLKFEDVPEGRVIQQIKKMLTDLLPQISSPDQIIIGGTMMPGAEKDPSGVHLQMPSGQIPLKDLSLGYKTMLAWAVDLALRLFENHPTSENPLAEPAIVLVDEMDLHLHPRWQREIRGFLVSHFPNTQFILTAHSPLMVQSAEDDNLAVLKWTNEGVIITNMKDEVKGLRVDQILLSEVFDLSSSRSTQIESLLNERYALLDNPARNSDETVRLKQLDDLVERIPFEDNLEDQKRLDLIRESAEKIKSLLNND